MIRAEYVGPPFTIEANPEQHLLRRPARAQPPPLARRAGWGRPAPLRSTPRSTPRAAPSNPVRAAARRSAGRPRLRRIALNCLQRDTSRKVGIKSKRLLAGWDHDYLLSLLTSW